MPSKANGKISKARLYSEFFARMEGAVSADRHFEAAWYGYAVLEDRLLSMLGSTGGAPTNRNGTVITGMKNKRVALEARLGKHPDILAELGNLKTWSESRNALAHAMANATKQLADIDAEAAALSQEALRLAKSLAAAALRLKKQSKKRRKPAT